MIAQRVGLTALRRGAAKPGMFTQNIPSLAVASRMSTSQPRSVATTKLTNDEGHQILVNQRLNRPVAPHLSIYKMGQTWFSASAWTRITGITLSGASYLYFISYLVAPLAGVHLESAALASAFAAAPLVVKGAVKFALGFPFTYHFINGIKHFVYDAGKGYAKKTILAGEKFVWASSILGGLYVAFGL